MTLLTALNTIQSHDGHMTTGRGHMTSGDRHAHTMTSHITKTKILHNTHRHTITELLLNIEAVT